MPDKTPQLGPWTDCGGIKATCTKGHCIGHVTPTQPPDKHQRLDTYDLLTGGPTLQVSFSSGLPPQGKTITLPYSEWKRQMEAIIARERTEATDKARVSVEALMQHELNNLKAFQQSIIEREQLKIEPIRICGVCSRQLGS